MNIIFLIDQLIVFSTTQKIKIYYEAVKRYKKMFIGFL